MERSLLLATLILCGCADKPIEWSEEVRTPDGRTYTLQRHQSFGSGGIFGEVSVPGDYWFEIEIEGGRRIRWEQKGPHPLKTVALLATQNDTYLLTLASVDTYRWGCPNPPYILWRLTKAVSSRNAYYIWYIVPLDQVPFRKFKSNMTLERRMPVGTYNNREWIIDFDLMKSQTFGDENCATSNRNMLIPK